MAAHGARVTGIDLSPRLIDMAREQDPDGTIDYRVGDLAEPHPDLAGSFGAIGSYLALNDVKRYREFAATLATLAKPGGRIALAFNNPYSSVVREHVSDYFDSTAMGAYLGMWKQGIEAHYYHRTLEEYLDAFLDAGLRLVRLVDIPDGAPMDILPPGSIFPRFMILAFAKD
jgi:2-polyprenyl-3-methyl-5-hydroxy-6-metoxy-1,4-benzoquinol methylase